MFCKGKCILHRFWYSINSRTIYILSEVFSDEMIKSMPKDNLKSFINMDKINIYDEKEIYIRVDENLDSTRKKVINSNERIIGKKEANYILNNSNVQTMSTSDSHNTAMKKMTMRLSDGSMSGYKTIQKMYFIF